jgi:CO/xanthine dehydrogenase FAD-binding subunit
MPVDEYHRPGTLDEALALRDEHGSSITVISGGTLTMPAINEGHVFPERVMDLRSLNLDTVDSSNGTLTLGATLTYTDVIEQIDDPMLTTAAEHCGSWAVRNIGTVGGNFFGPPTVGDFATALLARDAEVKLQSRDDERWIELANFYTGPVTTVLRDDELLTEIRVSAASGDTAYQKQTRNQEPAPAVVTVAANVERVDGSVSGARIGLNGAGPHLVRAFEAEEIVADGGLDSGTIEAAADAAAEAADPPTDALASDWYRRKMIGKQLERTLERLADGEGYE